MPVVGSQAARVICSASRSSGADGCARHRGRPDHTTRSPSAHDRDTLGSRIPPTRSPSDNAPARRSAEYRARNRSSRSSRRRLPSRQAAPARRRFGAGPAAAHLLSGVFAAGQRLRDRQARRDQRSASPSTTTGRGVIRASPAWPPRRTPHASRSLRKPPPAAAVVCVSESTPPGPHARIASATFSRDSPPARITGIGRLDDPRG